MTQVYSYAAESAIADLKPLQIERRHVGEHDIQIKIEYCGVCHSDIHYARNEWSSWSGGSLYPAVPGHEIIGKVISVGKEVSNFQVGDSVGVGVMIDSCQVCSECKDGLEQFCPSKILTYGSLDHKHNNSLTFGGYSQQIVVNEKFVLRVPINIDLKGAAPLLCAGITTWSPLRYWNVGAGDVVGIIGLGGLGHMGIKFAHALGCKVVMITTSASKAMDAKKLGADEVLISTDEVAMAKYANTFDFLLNTIPVAHSIDPYINLLKRDATMVIVGALAPLPEFNAAGLVFGRKKISGSIIGGIKETQEMLDFCGEHNITAEVEVIPIQTINDAFTRTIKGDVKYRFVIDMSSLT
jgi:alcohol dehydrogenase (NADP+)